MRNHPSHDIIRYCIFFVIAALTSLSDSCFAQDSLFVRRNSAALSCDEALPIGNGKLGAKVFGGAEIDSVLLFDENCTPFAKLTIHDNNKAESHFIKQTLNLNRALLKDEYEQNGLVFTREYFASYPDRVIGIRIRCQEGVEGENEGKCETGSKDEKASKIGCTISLTSAYGSSLDASANAISLKGFSNVNGTRMPFFCRLILNSTDGKAKAKDSSITIKDASEITLYLISENGGSSESSITDEIELQTERLKMKDFDKIRFFHISDYRNIFARFIPSGRISDSRFMNSIYRNYLFISWPLEK